MPWALFCTTSITNMETFAHRNNNSILYEINIDNTEGAIKNRQYRETGNRTKRNNTT